METKQETNDKPAQAAPAPAAPLATRAPDAPLAQHEEPGRGPLDVMRGGNGFAVLDNVRLEPKSFQEAMVCAELAAKIQLGNVSSSADALARIMRGATLGVDAMTSIESIFLINNRTFIEARLLHAVVLRSPFCGECTILEEESTAEIAYVRAQRVGKKAVTYKFTIAEAEAVVGGKDEFAKKDNYRKDPKGMLIARALERACNREWPDVTKGFLTMASIHDRDIVEHNPTTGTTIVTQAGQLPGTPARNFEGELGGLEQAAKDAKTEEDFASVRAEIEKWLAPEALKKRATNAYNEARKAWKAEQKGSKS